MALWGSARLGQMADSVGSKKVVETGQAARKHLLSKKKAGSQLGEWLHKLGAELSMGIRYKLVSGSAVADVLPKRQGQVIGAGTRAAATAPGTGTASRTGRSSFTSREGDRKGAIPSFKEDEDVRKQACPRSTTSAEAYQQFTKAQEKAANEADVTSKGEHVPRALVSVATRSGWELCVPTGR